MNAKTRSYRGYRFPSESISQAVWLYSRFCLSYRDVEDLPAERGVIVSHETIRQWSRKFGAEYARKLEQREGRLVGICCGQPTTGYCGPAPSLFGMTWGVSDLFERAFLGWRLQADTLRSRPRR